jgi:hypothetical protein
VTEVRSPSSSGGSPERVRVLLLAALIVGGVTLYIAFGREPGADRANLLPYQALVQTLPASERQMYADLRKALSQAEAERAQHHQWPDPEWLAARGVVPFAETAGSPVQWRQFRQGASVIYFGAPGDPSAPAWILMIQEPEANTPPDPAPNDDEHHRLPDGTTLHIYVWMHRYGGQVPARFVPQPQAEGWIELFATPPNPVLPRRT